MSEIIPYVPNLTVAPINPSLGDCYYHINQDKYYVYNGSQWIEPVLEGGDQWRLSYKQAGDTDYTVRTCYSYGSLFSYLDDNNITPTDVIVEAIVPDCVLIPRSGNSEGNWGLIKLKINGSLVPVGRIAPKIVFKSGGTITVPEYITINNRELSKVYFDRTLVYTDSFRGYILTYTDENNNTYSVKYTNYEDLITFLQTTNIMIKEINILEKGG